MSDFRTSAQRLDRIAAHRDLDQAGGSEARTIARRSLRTFGPSEMVHAGRCADRSWCGLETGTARDSDFRTLYPIVETSVFRVISREIRAMAWGGRAGGASGAKASSLLEIPE